MDLKYIFKFCETPATAEHQWRAARELTLPRQGRAWKELAEREPARSWRNHRTGVAIVIALADLPHPALFDKRVVPQIFAWPRKAGFLRLALIRMLFPRATICRKGV